MLFVDAYMLDTKLSNTLLCEYYMWIMTLSNLSTDFPSMTIVTIEIGRLTIIFMLMVLRRRKSTPFDFITIMLDACIGTIFEFVRLGWVLSS